MALQAGCSGGNGSNGSPSTAHINTEAPDGGKQADEAAAPSSQPSATPSEEVIYENTRYGFTFTLPPGWTGYKIIDSRWEGRAVEGESAGDIVETGR
jgi:hypothetical protein